ncbi:hypothetical protein [Cecembia rubra]|uniref:hypothetical protein n=1 Tax=Cecembia rubra TaxID=1485585 RepID=UPI000D0D4A19|nr:hypothetical protein [Cecembia rubra]
MQIYLFFIHQEFLSGVYPKKIDATVNLVDHRHLLLKEIILANLDFIAVGESQLDEKICRVLFLMAPFSGRLKAALFQIK